MNWISGCFPSQIRQRKTSTSVSMEISGAGLIKYLANMDPRVGFDPNFADRPVQNANVRRSV